ncbi:hypothetical protein [Streptomyces sp. NPDC097981]|uniref:hypothetical protein n=1 Tax=Streptomyces sp. NPDC097981 TaxID=3155428 RepID=UPI003327B430
MPAAEVSPHDVGLALSAVEESAGFGGGFGLVPGLVGVGQAAFEVGADQLVGDQLGWALTRIEALQLSEQVTTPARSTSNNRNRHLLELAAAHTEQRDYACRPPTS